MRGDKKSLNYKVVEITSDRIDTHLAYPIITIEDIFNWEWYDIMLVIHRPLHSFSLDLLWEIRRKEVYGHWRKNMVNYGLTGRVIRPPSYYNWYIPQYIWQSHSTKRLRT